MERDFCQRCGSALDPKTGQCPDCSRRRSRGGWIAVAVVAVVICLGIYCLLPGGPLRPAAEAALHKIEAIFAPKPEPALPEPAAPLEHTAPLDAQQEALMTAQDLLIDEYFSPADLLDRLEALGYSTEAAEFAVVNCGANWSEEATYAAMNYLSNYYLSPTELADQLVLYGFTEEEALYGVEHCGADWMEEAVLNAQFYLEEYPELTQAEVEELLVSCGFTEEQAAYGAAEAYGAAGNLL